MNRPLMDMLAGTGNLRQKVEGLQSAERQLRSVAFKLQNGGSDLDAVNRARAAVRHAERMLEGAMAEVEQDISNYRAACASAASAEPSLQLEVLT